MKIQERFNKDLTLQHKELPHLIKTMALFCNTRKLPKLARTIAALCTNIYMKLI